MGAGLTTPGRHQRPLAATPASLPGWPRREERPRCRPERARLSAAQTALPALFPPQDHRIIQCPPSPMWAAARVPLSSPLRPDPGARQRALEAVEKVVTGILSAWWAHLSACDPYAACWRPAADSAAPGACRGRVVRGWRAAGLC